MIQSDLIKFTEDTFKDLVALLKAKNSDYTSGDNDVFKNLSYCEMLGVASTEAGILIRMSDKMSRLSTAIQGKDYQVKDENVQNSCKDLIGYTVLLMALLESKKPKITQLSNGMTLVEEKFIPLNITHPIHINNNLLRTCECGSYTCRGEH